MDMTIKEFFDSSRNEPNVIIKETDNNILCKMRMDSSADGFDYCYEKTHYSYNPSDVENFGISGTEIVFNN